MTDKLREALEKLHHAVCGETGFAAAVRQESGKAYPWPALDIADELARPAPDPLRRWTRYVRRCISVGKLTPFLALEIGQCLIQGG